MKPERATAVKTCSHCPTQWEGLTRDGRRWYFRFRNGWVSLGFGDDMNAAVDAGMENELQISDTYDGSMTDEQFARWWEVLAAKWAAR